MKTIGLLGGMSWESTAHYYRLLNELTREQRGGLHSARCVLYSVDFEQIERLQHRDDWGAAALLLADAARRVEAGGADFLLICTNTMHKVADEIASAITIPLLHLADATAERIVASGVRTVGLLGTRFTMEQDFYRERLEARGISVLLPDSNGRETVHRVIYDELCQGLIHDESRSAYLEIIEELASRGAEAVILGCTEIGLLVQAEHTAIPLLDTTQIHAERAIQIALAD